MRMKELEQDNSTKRTCVNVYSEREKKRPQSVLAQRVVPSFDKDNQHNPNMT